MEWINDIVSDVAPENSEPIKCEYCEMNAVIDFENVPVCQKCLWIRTHELPQPTPEP